MAMKDTKVTIPEALSVGKHKYIAAIEYGTKRWEATKAKDWNKGRSLDAEEIKKAREEYEANARKKLGGGIESPVRKKRVSPDYIPGKIRRGHQKVRDRGFVWPFDGLIF